MGQRKKTILWVVGVLAVTLAALVVSQFLLVQKAHSSFENYYAFRGCTQLLEKTDAYATCQLADGKTIKMVQVNGKWYLDGDLPVCYFHFCL